jgi:hypothetical protein
MGILKKLTQVPMLAASIGFVYSTASAFYLFDKPSNDIGTNG